MANRWYNQFTRTPHHYQVNLDCNFVVDSTNGNGFGIRNLKGPGIAAVYMHTSATPAPKNPNPPPGYIYVKLQDSFQKYFYGASGFVSPTSGSNIAVLASGAALTVHQPYVITSVGTSTAADWIALGVPSGVTPAVGVAFIAAVTGAGTGSGQVQLPKATGSGIDHIEVVGDPNTTTNSTGANVLGSASGSYMILQCLAPTSSSVTTMVATAPADGTVIGLQFSFSNTMITIQGE